MKIQVNHRCADYKSYRAARVKSLFNAESGCNFDLTAEIPIEDHDWSIGVIVGPSGSGKTSLGRKILGQKNFYEGKDWPPRKPIIDAISPQGSFNQVTAALAAVGLGDVPAWLRPYRVLSNGEKFRADLARIVAESPPEIVIDEFTSVVDRRIAQIGAGAFAKAWRRTGGKAVLLSCHYDILDWLEPDWVYDTGTGKFSGRWERQREWYKRPKIELQIHETNWRYWSEFEPHHYLKLPRMVAARCYVGTVDGERVCHLGMGSIYTGFGMEARACRLVVLPEWQGAGIGIKFLNRCCQLQLEGEGVRRGWNLTTLFHTSHPGLCAALRRLPQWSQVSCHLYGANKKRSATTLKKKKQSAVAANTGYGGHFRAVQGFRFWGNKK